MPVAIEGETGHSSMALQVTKPVVSACLRAFCGMGAGCSEIAVDLSAVALALQIAQSRVLVRYWEGRHGSMENMTPHLLIVEDDSEMRDLLRKVLEKEGYRVSVAVDGRDAEASLSRDAFDLVVTDMLMPDDGGLELLRAVRETHPTLPVIILTAFGDWGSYSQALELGAAAFISKPLKMGELIGAIHTALVGRGAGQAV